MADPCPKNLRQSFVPKSAEVPLHERPLELNFTLPDHARARVVEDSASTTIDIFEGPDLARVASFSRKEGDKARTSLHGVVQDCRAQHEDIWELKILSQPDPTAKVRATWVGLYGCELWQSAISRRRRQRH